LAAVRSNGLNDEPQYKIEIDREKANALSLTVSDVIQSSLIGVLTSLQLSLGYYKGSLHQTEKNTPVKHRILHA
jgi:multidrug efflux pump subunit AcrB